MTRFYIQDQGVKFYGTVLSNVGEKEVYDTYNLYSPYRYYFVEFDTGNDKIYPRVMNIKINRMNTYRYIACETEMRPCI